MEPIKLKRKIKRGDTTIGTLTLSEPTGQALKGLALSALFQADVNTIQVLVTRGCCQPTLTRDEAKRLGLVDLSRIGDQFIQMMMDDDEDDDEEDIPEKKPDSPGTE